VQELQVDCGFHVVLNARSLTKFVLDRDEDSAVANLKDSWQPPSSALPEVHQYRKQLCIVQHVTALPFGVGVGAASANRARSAPYVHNNRSTIYRQQKGWLPLLRKTSAAALA
jgi:hypothetical protein